MRHGPNGRCINRIYAGTSEVMRLITGRGVFADSYRSLLD